ncbi:MAG: hypothetical protein WCS27_16705 [Victivallaceae bacterium]
MKLMFIPILGFAAFFVCADIPGYRMIAYDSFRWPKPVKTSFSNGFKPVQIDLNGDGVPERIVPDPGGGSGGPIWHIEQKNAEGNWNKISEYFFGWGQLVAPKNGYFRIVTISKCGWRKKIFLLYEFNDKTYVCVRGEAVDYKDKTLKIGIGEKKYSPTSFDANLYRIEQRIRRALEQEDATDYYLKVDYPDTRTALFGTCTFAWNFDDPKPQQGYGFKIGVYCQYINGSVRIYGSNTPIFIRAVYGKRIDPKLRKRLEKALSGTFILIVSNQSLSGGEKSLKIELDGKAFVQQKFSKDRDSLQHTFYSFPTFLSEGKHKIKVSRSGVTLGKEFVINEQNDVGTLFFFCQPWYKLMSPNTASFKTQKAPVLFR